MHVEATGHKPLNYNLSLKRMSDMQDLYLERSALRLRLGLALRSMPQS